MLANGKVSENDQDTKNNSISSSCASPASKKVKLSKNDNKDLNLNSNITITILSQCISLILTSSDKPDPTIPISITSNGKIGNDLNKARHLFDNQDFRTSIISSPRSALSIYKDSCYLSPSLPTTTTMSPQCSSNIDNKQKKEAMVEKNDNNDIRNAKYNGKEFLLSMIGMHPKQNIIENIYIRYIKPIYCLSRFCQRIIKTLLDVNAAAVSINTNNNNDISLLDLLQKIQHQASHIVKDIYITNTDDYDVILLKLQEYCSLVPNQVSIIMSEIINKDPRVRLSQLEREYERIQALNSSFANARIQLFLNYHGTSIKEIFFKRCIAQPKFERITIYFYDKDIDYTKPDTFTFLPSLHTVLGGGGGGAESVANSMVESFWSNILKEGYFASEFIKDNITPCLYNFFLSGLVQDIHIPFKLNAHFTPKYPLSLYIHGLAGSGKSSFVSKFSPALNNTIETYADPQILVRFVKQNLNKSYDTLQSEFELRPNNNDLSIMSIIQGRKCTLNQPKPGLVVIGLEEMPSNNNNNSDPINQLNTCQLISQRFGGRKSTFNKNEINAPRNSKNRGIANDSSLITIFTSNYNLELDAVTALKRLPMFTNLIIFKVNAVDDIDRINFAKTYLLQCVSSQLTTTTSTILHNNDESAIIKDIDLNIPLGAGDTRPLVRELRMLSFFVCELTKKNIDGSNNNNNINKDKKLLQISIIFNDNTQKTVLTINQSKSIELRLGSFDNIYPVNPKIFNSRVNDIICNLQKLRNNSFSVNDNASSSFNKNQDIKYQELAQIIDYYFSNALAPAVIVSQNENLIKDITSCVASTLNGENVHLIPNINPDTYKMMKSLYDNNSIPNLRDDIIGLGAGKVGTFVSIELKCYTIDSQLCIREMIEDSPSMTAFSSSKSALYKKGLFFGVYVKGDITPEVLSRASLVL